MIFSPDLVEKILAGEKYVTRRPIKPGQQRYWPGREYAIQTGRGKPAVGRIRVSFVTRERLGDIDAEDARDEGFPTVDAFFDRWRDLYGAPVDVDQRVWRIEFMLVEEAVPA